MTHSNGRIVVAGESLVDVITSPAGDVREVPGGGPYNTARTIARLGQPVAFLGCVSRDQRGERLMSELVADGVDLSLVIRTDAPTTVAHATLDARGRPPTGSTWGHGGAPPLSGPLGCGRSTRPGGHPRGTLGARVRASATCLEDVVEEAAPADGS